MGERAAGRRIMVAISTATVQREGQAPETASSANVYVADSGNSRIEKFRGSAN
jgi:hypothetical protein